MHSFINQLIDFIENCRVEDDSFKYASTPQGHETLYASCFACMLYHYVTRLEEFTKRQKEDWANYLNSWQDAKTGLFVGPEIVKEELTSAKHDWGHVTMHLTAHVLPVLEILGQKPLYPLYFAKQFLDLNYLHSWLNQRDWHDAWLEGNNLLFIGQFLIHLRDGGKNPAAQLALDHYFKWLDKEQDAATGLWGTNGFCSNGVALYGGYHQLLVYYFEDHPVRYPERLIDVALSLQHKDGGFNPAGGGGACEDVDAVDILVNMYKLINYRRPEIRVALRRTFKHILKMQMSDGGFVYRMNQPFVHMGIKRTASGPNQSNLFPTWFRIHTLALISEILTGEFITQFNWKFNNSCSMGWHKKWDKSKNQLTHLDRIQEIFTALKNSILKKEWIY